VRVVLSWLREFAPTDLDADELAELITARGVKVEAVLRPWDGLAGVVAARVLEVVDHPDSDKLCVARVEDGAGEHVVVVGVRNMVAGDIVPWARPGARVPVLPEPLAAKPLRGVVSNGMLCSPRELAISEDHGGILVLNGEGIEPGADVAAALGLEDAVLDIEVEPNRPDFLSVLGVAREVAAATGVPLSVPSPPATGSEGSAAPVGIEIRDLDACPRYLARVIRGVRTVPSPLRAQARISASGMRPISAVVDATNYTMLELGQPLHAFDLDLLAGPGIVVRRAEAGERLQTLDGIDRALSDEDLLICDLGGPVAIAGVMGGAQAEVSGSTTDVLLESASFTRTGILRTARRLDLHSEASHRFERGTDPEGLALAAARCADLMAAWAGGTVLGDVAEAGHAPDRRWVSLRPARASSLLGYPVSAADAVATFDALGMAHRTAEADTLEVEVPGYRVDIDREVDLIEEVARIQGYDRIASTLPASGRAGGMPPAYAFTRRLREVLLRAGLHETRLLSFASAEDVALTGDTDAIPVANPLQAEEGLLRTRLIPGLLRAAARNQARGVRTVELFEIGNVFRFGDPVQERSKVAVLMTGPAHVPWDASARPYDALDLKGVVAALMAELRIHDWSLGPAPGGPFHPGRAATITVEGSRIGVLGELHPRRAEELQLEGRVAVAELEVDALREAAGRARAVLQDVPRFPPVRRDLAFVVAEDVPAGDVQTGLEAAAGELLGAVSLFDVHRGTPLAPGEKSLAFSVDLRARDRTLTSEEADAIVGEIVGRLRDAVGAVLRTG
jgi:phenylalanyl-tRNA synthetase beta chain